MPTDAKSRTPGPESITERIAQLQAAIAAQEGLRGMLGNGVADATIAALREQLLALERDQGAPAPQAERKLVTILFADLTGFTSLAERTDPETARLLMNACFDALKEALDRYGGHIDKYIGDEIIPLSYGRANYVVQPRLRHYPLMPVAFLPLKDVVIED